VQWAGLVSRPKSSSHHIITNSIIIAIVIANYIIVVKATFAQAVCTHAGNDLE